MEDQHREEQAKVHRGTVLVPSVKGRVHQDLQDETHLNDEKENSLEEDAHLVGSAQAILLFVLVEESEVGNCVHVFSKVH